MSYQIGFKSGDKLWGKSTWVIPDDLSYCVKLKTAAKALNYTERGLLNRIKAGKENGFKINRRWYVSFDSITYDRLFS